jgi:chromosome segregation ATPase
MAAPPPFIPFTNGLRSQATSGDARAERLVRAVRMEVSDLRQAIDSWGEGRDQMLEVELEAVRADPAAAATIPAAALVRGLVAAAHRISALETDLDVSERQLAAARDELARLQEEHSYVRGRTETLHDVIAALHGNLDDLRAERNRQPRLEAPEPRALRPGHSEADPFGMGGAFR